MKGILLKPEVWQAKLRVLEQYGEAQTRRVIKPQPIQDGAIWSWRLSTKAGRVLASWAVLEQTFRNGVLKFAPYKVGETVYIKEAWFWNNILEAGLNLEPEIRDQFLHYRLDGEANDQFPEDYIDFKWTSPLFMPEWAARYFIVITDVRAERLQEITEEDIRAEGITDLGIVPVKTAMLVTSTNNLDDLQRALGRDMYASLWDSTNKEKWESNPWVWVYTFGMEVKT